MRRWYANESHRCAAIALRGCGGGSSNNSDGGSGGGSVQFTASGEVLALGGYAFPPATAGDPDFVDGWEMHFTKFIAVFDKVTLVGEARHVADRSVADRQARRRDRRAVGDRPAQGRTAHGQGRQRRAGLPDRHASRTRTRTAAPPFDPTMRYAFGFDSVPATAVGEAPADRRRRRRLRGDGAERLERALRRHRDVEGRHASCTSTNPSYDFSTLPTTVNFRLGFATPTTYVNCQNPDNDPAKGLGGEEHERGVQVKANDTTIAQVTFHTDHPFWESFTHDTPAHFDQLAALAKKQTDGSYLVTLDDTKGVDYTAFKDRRGQSAAVARLRRGLHAAEHEPADGLRQPVDPAQPVGRSGVGRCATTRTTCATTSRRRATSTPTASATSSATTRRRSDRSMRLKAYRAVAALVLATILVGGQLASFAHFAATPHIECSDDGELIHVSVLALSSVGPATIAKAEAIPDHPHRHDHCQVVSVARTPFVRARKATPLASPSCRGDIQMRVARSAPPRAIAILDQAPKCSPPSPRPPSKEVIGARNGGAWCRVGGGEHVGVPDDGASPSRSPGWFAPCASRACSRRPSTSFSRSRIPTRSITATRTALETSRPSTNEVRDGT